MSPEPPCFNLPVGAAVTVYLGLGSNVGDRRAQLTDAIRRLREIMLIEQSSSVYETEPVGHTEQDDFWNMVLRGQTDLPARELMSRIIEIERAMGRERTFKNAPRNIDIDILLYDDVVMTDTDLQIPHPRMHTRAFVLKPLLEIAPDVVNPKTHIPYSRILADSCFERAEPIGQLS